MSIVKIAKRKDVTFEYDANGFAQEEVLKGECDQAKFVRCSLQPGKSVKPELYSTVEHTQVFLFLEGKGISQLQEKDLTLKMSLLYLFRIMIQRNLKSHVLQIVRNHWNIFILSQN